MKTFHSFILAALMIVAIFTPDKLGEKEVILTLLLVGMIINDRIK